MQEHPIRIVVFASSPMVTVTLEADARGDTEVHFHAGGQGVWAARMIQRLGVAATLCTSLGGESGRVLRALLEAEQCEVLAVEVEHPNGAYVHDRRAGARTLVGEHAPLPLNRHELDELYGCTVSAAIAAGTCVITGTVPSVVPHDTFRRLTSDLRCNGVDVIVDTSREPLAAALTGRPPFIKISHEELISDGYAADCSDDSILEGIRRLQTAGAHDVVVSRAAAPVLASLAGRLIAVDCPSVEVVDATGGGDTMTAALAVAVARKLNQEDGLRLAVAAATLNVTRHGLATGRRQDIERLAEAITVRELSRSSTCEQWSAASDTLAASVHSVAGVREVPRRQ